MSLPSRFGPYLLVLLLALGAVLLWSLMSPPPPAPAVVKEAPLKPVLSSSPPAPPLPSPPIPRPAPQTVVIDAENESHANQLNAPGNTPQQDLEIVRDFVNLYHRAFGGNPVGNNEDITAALTGTADPSRPGRVFPPHHVAIQNGQLVDRWGTPFWFHAESGSKMEIRSAGPDKQLFTRDDVVLMP